MIRSGHYSKWVWCTVPRSPRFHLYYCSTKWQIHLDCSQTGCLPTSRNDHSAIHLTEKERKRMFVSASLCRRSILNNLHVSLAESFFIPKHVLICSKYQLSSGCHIHVCDVFILSLHHPCPYAQSQGQLRWWFTSFFLSNQQDESPIHSGGCALVLQDGEPGCTWFKQPAEKNQTSSTEVGRYDQGNSSSKIHRRSHERAASKSAAQSYLDLAQDFVPGMNPKQTM